MPNIPVLKYVLLSENASAPKKSSEFAAGFDIASACDTVVPARGKTVVPTDLKIELPPNCYGRLTARSSLAKNFHITLGCGTIDNDYRGELGIVLFNHRNRNSYIHKGDRIAQLICEPYISPLLQQVTKLSETVRGAGGFGSSGR
jgi:dUTP pyrophosphatase